MPDAQDRLEVVAPIRKIDVYPNGCIVVKRELLLLQPPQKGGLVRGKRSKIMEFSKQSMLRLMFVAQATDIVFKSMFTMTYPALFPKDGKIVKEDLKFMLKTIRKLYGDGCEYLWFFEFQPKRGAPHVHILLTVSSITPYARAYLGLCWTKRVCTSDWFFQEGAEAEAPPERLLSITRKCAAFNCHENVFELIRDANGARKYVTKYASKQGQKEVPEEFKNVGRLWGNSQGVKPKAEMEDVDMTSDELRYNLESINHPARTYSVTPKYIVGMKGLANVSNRPSADSVD